jgi:hypothetical protein
MLSVSDPKAALERLGQALSLAYHDENSIRALLSRARPI